MAGTRVLNDRYEMGPPLGKGGMAHVYRGTDRVLDRTVAIKVLAERYAHDDRFVDRFRREAQAAAGLTHPNVVGVYDTGGEDGMHYIVMEYVEGPTLSEVLRREGRLDPDRAAAIAAEVATALHSAHERGLVHRDVKPGNVMLDRDGRVKVVDFGIARAAADDTLTQTGLILGTASYLSPEQAQGLTVDARSDVYSLGCVLYEMLTGRPPFQGETPVSIAYKHVNERAVRPSTLNADVPPHLDQAVMRALEKDPDARFATAEAFRQAIAGDIKGAATVPIAAAGGDTDVLPATSTTPTRTAAPRRRNVSWLPVALIAAAVLAVIGVIAIAFREPDAAARRQGGQAEQGQPPAEEPTDVEVTSVGQALGQLEDVVIQAVNAGELSEETGGKILEEAGKAFEEYSAGELEGALEALGSAHEEIDKAAAGVEGQFASPAAATAIHAAIDAVAEAMSASPPAAEEGEGNGEEGNGGEGQGNGEGNGNGRSDEKGKEGEGNGG
ncbi:MAG TPA: protein kinase [Actinomycetota bacterium]|nr:protein kinase [Actinomycetota bacterium]